MTSGDAHLHSLALEAFVSRTVFELGRRDRFEDTGLTVIDHATGLEWEKKTDDGSIHDKDNVFNWSNGFGLADGSIFTDFLGGRGHGLNYCPSSDGTTIRSGFAGHCDWRIPTIHELRTILDCDIPPACVHPIFGPTVAGDYWSSTNDATNPSHVWSMDFGQPGPADRSFVLFPALVRAVRGPVVLAAEVH